MKKLTIFLIIAFMVILTACSNESNESYPESESYSENEPYSESEPYPEFSIEFVYTMGDEILFQTAEELLAHVDHVFVGRVERVSFTILNDETGRAPTEECNPHHLALVTIYDVAVLTAHRGAQQSTMRVATLGGTMGYRESEQLSLLVEAGLIAVDGVYHVPINIYASDLRAGEVFMFAVPDIDVELDGYSAFVGRVNSRQSFIDLDDPLKDEILAFLETSNP